MVPLIDISPSLGANPIGKRAVAAEIDCACRETGFLIVTGHGVPDTLVDRTWRLTRTLFDLPETVKLAHRAPPRGYSPIGTTALAYTNGEVDSAPDFREVFSVGRHDLDDTHRALRSPSGRPVFPPNVYPHLPGLRETLEDYYTAMANLSTRLMRLFALALGLDEHWFDDKIDYHMSNLSLSNYPEQPAPPGRSQLRAGAHTDWGSLTILKTEEAPGGLEVRSADGTWSRVPIIPESFIVNIGDLMAQWTNDRWVSTMHRVVNPPRDNALASRRQSLIFFHQPNHDARVECIPSCVGTGALYPVTTSAEYLWDKLNISRVHATARP
jgi:isopenicillin N synthase-like dioxygenase